MNHARDAMSTRPVRTSLVALVAAMSLLFTGVASGSPLRTKPAARHGSNPGQSRASQTGTPATPLISGQVSAHGGKFWVGTTPIVLHGKKGVVETNNITQALLNVDNAHGWGFNFIRLHIQWADFEPNAPTLHGTSWTHTYDVTQLNRVKQVLDRISSYGMVAMVANFNDDDNYFGTPDWLEQAPYNSHGITYPLTDQGKLDASTNLWSDPLQQQFIGDFLAWLSASLSSQSGIAGYELLNEPDQGAMDNSLATTQLMLGVQLAWAKRVRSADPMRIIFFQTRAGFGPGLPHADFSNWVNPAILAQPLAIPDVAADVHDYFGARWGSGLQQNPNSGNYLEFFQDLYASTTNGVLGTAPPYIGTTLGHERWVMEKKNAILPWNFGLIVGEFGVANTDPDAGLFFGTAVSAFTYLCVSWSVSGANYGITNGDTGGLEPYGPIVVDAAKVPCTP